MPNIRRFHAQFIFAASLLGLLLLWQFLSGPYPDFLLPGPLLVADRFVVLIGNGRLGVHLWATLAPTIISFLAALIIGSSLGYLAAKSPTAKHLLLPYTVALQAIPIVALLPLLIIWLGPGWTTRVTISELIAFFPVFVGTLAAFSEIPTDLKAVFATYATKPWQRFVWLEVPYALPAWFAALRLSISFALIGTVVAELMTGNRGLGYLVNFGRGLLDTPLVFAALFGLIGLGLALQLCLIVIEKLTLKYR